MMINSELIQTKQMKLNMFSFKNVTYFKKIITQNSIRFVNYSVIDHELLNLSHLHGHFAPAYLVGSNVLRAYLFFIYGCGISNQD